MKRLKPYLWILKLQWQASKTAFIWTIFYSIFQGLYPLVNTFAIAKLITAVSSVALTKGPTSDVYLWLTVLLFLEVLNVFITNISYIFRELMQKRMNIVMSDVLIDKMYSLSQEQFDDEAFNTRISRATDAINQVWSILDESSFIFSSAIRFVGAMIAISIASPLVGLVIVVATLPSLLFQLKHNRVREKVYEDIEPYSRIARRSLWLLFDPQQMPEIRTINAFKNLANTWRINMIKTQKITLKSNKELSIKESFAYSIEPFVSFLANIFFFRQLVSGILGLEYFIFLRGIITETSSSMQNLANSISRMHEISINMTSFNKIIEMKPAIPNGNIKPTAPLTIEFEDVSFKYPKSDKYSIKNVSLKIVPGSKLALVGENGAGKSTLIKLLLRQYLPSSGRILVNGVDIKDIDSESYLKQLATLSQDYLVISHLTIKDNLSLGVSKDVKDSEIYAVTDLVDASNFLKKLPKQLDTRLDTSFKDGSSLSGGQLQRLGVARALLRNSDILILDEPTSAIDAKAEFNIFNNIYKSHATKTTLIVSHRFSTVRKADRIIVLDHGEVVEYGSHEELIEYNGLYREMFDLQAEGYR